MDFKVNFKVGLHTPRYMVAPENFIVIIDLSNKFF